MKLAHALVFTALFIFSGFMAQSATGIMDKDLEGTYEYESNDAPYGYHKGVLELRKEDKKWKASIRIGEQTIQGQEVKVMDDKVQFKVYVEGTTVTVKLKQKEDNLAGTASTYDGVMKVTAKKKAKK